MTWLPLKKNDYVQIIAPASKVPLSEQAEVLDKVKSLLHSWQLQPVISEDLFSENTLMSNLANTDEYRFEDLISAIQNPEVKAIWCLRGGYGCLRLLESLDKLPKQDSKLFIGFSDITVLHTYFQQRWGWLTLHAYVAKQVAMGKTTDEDVQLQKQIMFGEIEKVSYKDFLPWNKTAKKTKEIHSEMTGGNLTLIDRMLATRYAVNLKEKILMLEDIDEPARKIDGMLWHLKSVYDLKEKDKPDAVIFGDFICKDDEKDDIENIIEEFSEYLDELNIPVLRCHAISHGEQNHPIPLGTETKLVLGDEILCEIKVHC